MAANKIVRTAVLGALAVGAVAFGVHWWQTGRWLESTDNAYVRADIAVITPRIAGEIVEVAVRENQLVKKGEVLVRIDPRDYQARLANAQAQVAQAEAALVANSRQQEMQAAMIDEARASLNAAEADRVRVRKDYERASSLVKDGVATQARLDTASAGYQSAQATVTRGSAALKAARTQIGTLEAERARLEAQLQATKAAEQLAALDLEATVLRAPSDGLVGNLAAKLGERVSPGLRLLSLVAAGTVWVEANYKETQLTHVAVGQPVLVHVDAFPDAEIKGRVESVAPASGAEFALLPADNATGNFTKIVQRVPVKVTLEVPAELADKLRSGMSVEAEINTKPGA
ncbi:MAG: HlyD family secretion protein [Nevskiaceae bacterium]|nr:MAG: HlyD family secretion protein [Nevskiaceae bacterium]